MEVLFLRQEQPGATEDIQDAERHRHALGDDRRHTGTGHAHAQRSDEPEVEDDVEHRREDEEDQRHEAVADGPQPVAISAMLPLCSTTPPTSWQS